MTYEQLVEKVRNATKKAIASKCVGHIAYQFNVVGEAEGAFYLEITDGRINVEPYEYYDRDVLIVTSAAVIMDMAEGKLQPMLAYLDHQLEVYGDVEQLKLLPFRGEKKKTKTV